MIVISASVVQRVQRCHPKRHNQSLERTGAPLGSLATLRVASDVVVAFMALFQFGAPVAQFHRSAHSRCPAGLPTGIADSRRGYVRRSRRSACRPSLARTGGTDIHTWRASVLCVCGCRAALAGFLRGIPRSAEQGAAPATAASLFRSMFCSQFQSPFCAPPLPPAAVG